MKVFLALPCHDGKPCMSTVYTIIDFIAAANARGIAVDLRGWAGDSDVTSARNILTGMFMQTDCTDLLFIDADNDCEPGALMRLLDYPVEFVCATYRCKTDDAEKYTIRWPETKFHVADKETGLLEAAAVPFGLVRLRRSVIEKMIAAYSHLGYDCSLAPGVPVWSLFDREIINRQRWGEDFNFCRRWREIGGKVWVDPNVLTGHTGPKRFEGHLGQALVNNGNVVKKDDIRLALSGVDYETLIKQGLGEAA